MPDANDVRSKRRRTQRNCRQRAAGQSGARNDKAVEEEEEEKNKWKMITGDEDREEWKRTEMNGKVFSKTFAFN